MVLASFLPGECGNATMNTSFIAVYELYEGQDSNLRLLQCLESRGVVDLESFEMKVSQEDRWMLAVAQRQVEDDLSVSMPSYKQDSSIYIWNNTARQYQLFQHLDSSFKSSPDSSSTEEQKHRFCALSGGNTNQKECIDETFFIPGLRGTTSISYFDHGGEGHLAVAQSVCPMFASDDFCKQLNMSQPQSAVLQFDRGRGVFTEMKRLTQLDNIRMRGTSAKPSDYAQEMAMRFDGGRAAGIKFLNLYGEPYLLLCSLTRGALLLKWEFEQVSGLAAVNTIATDPTGSRVLAGSASLRTLSLVAFPSNQSLPDPESFDIFGSPVCEKSPCLISKDVVSEKMNSPMRPDMPPNLLGGLRRVQWSAQAEWVVQTGLPVSEILCASGMPATHVPDPGPHEDVTGVIDLQLMNPACQDLSFVINGSGNLGMFSRAPHLYPNGTLSFVQAAHGWGKAAFDVRLDDGKLVPDAGVILSSFEIDIAPKAALTFELTSAGVLEVDAVPEVEQQVVFAFNFSRARVPLAAQDIPRLRFHADVGNESLFARSAASL